jgi:hypothetical protein
MAGQAIIVAEIIPTCLLISNEAIEPTYIKEFDDSGMH